MARRYNQRSKLGAILDPIADKGLLLAGLLTLTFSDWGYHFPLWFPVLVITRDVVIVAGSFGLHYLNGDVHVRPRWTGKIATVLQMIAIGWVMLQLRLVNPAVPVPWRGSSLLSRVSATSSTASGSSSTTNTPGLPSRHWILVTGYDRPRKQQPHRGHRRPPERG